MWVCTTRSSVADYVCSISCPCSSLHPLPLLLSLLTKHQLVFCLLNLPALRFLGCCWQEEGADGRAVRRGRVPDSTPPERALEHAELGLHCSKLEFSYSINAINIIVHAV